MQPLVNQAQLSYNGITTKSNITKGEIVAVISATKAALFDSYRSDDIVTILLNITNSGTTAFNNLTIYEDLRRYSYTPPVEPGEPDPPAITLFPLTYIDNSMRHFQKSVQMINPTVTRTPAGLTITGVNLPPETTSLLLFQAKINEYAKLDIADTILSTSTIDSADLTNPITAAVTLNTHDAPFLTIVKNICPEKVAENGTVTYTFTISNYGNTAADVSSNAVVKDTFTPPLLNPTFMYNGSQIPDASFSYNEESGVFETVPGLINIPAATFTQDKNGVVSITPGERIISASGTI